MPFHKRRSGIKLFVPFEERRLLEPKFGWNFPKQPVMVQPKLDGERCHPIGHILPEVELISSECNPIVSVPHINYALKEQGLTDIESDGELYIHGMDFSDIHSIVSRKSDDTLNPDAHKMGFHIFDIAWPNGQQLLRSNWLAARKVEPPLYIVPIFICSSMNEIMDTYQDILSQGYEGIIIRHIMAPYERKRSNMGMKFKAKKIDEYEIIDVIEAVSEAGEPKGMVGSFLCHGEDGTPFKVGAGQLSHMQRIEIWEDHIWHKNVIGNYVKVEYQNLTVNKVPRFGLAIEII